GPRPSPRPSAAAGCSPERTPHRHRCSGSCYLFRNRQRNREDEMTVELNHTIIPAKDKWKSAKFLADILGLEAGPEWSHFAPVRTSNGVTLDFADATEFRRQHYAFLVSEPEFDAALSRIKRAST